MTFNNSQLEAISSDASRVLVLAGPGSGKTTTIAQRISTILDRGVNPSEILVVTFTRASALEMRQRYLKKDPQRGGRISFGTFHAIFFQILKTEYALKGDCLIKDSDSRNLLKAVLDALALFDDPDEKIEDILRDIGKFKNSSGKVTDFEPASCSTSEFTSIYRMYNSRMHQMGMIDFDDMQLMCYKLLTEREQTLAKWQGRYKYILIDEFQDINRLQYALIKMLAAPENNIFAVGDDDQSIYAFRGADPGLLQEFLNDFEDAKRVILDVNYRSDKLIVECANNLISHNKERMNKAISAFSSADGSITITEYKDVIEEAESIITKIKSLITDGVHESEIAVLFRTNAESNIIMEKCIEENINFCAKDVTGSIYDHWITNDILAFMDLAAAGYDRGKFLQIMNRPGRGIARDRINSKIADNGGLLKAVADNRFAHENMRKLLIDLSLIKNMAPYAAVNYIRQGMGYDRYIADYAERKGIEEGSLTEILDYLMIDAKSFKTYFLWKGAIEVSREKMKEIKSSGRYAKDAVSLSTMHGSKGLEYEYVFVVNANESICPGKQAVTTSEIEEERRLFYVAITRAKKQLDICYVNSYQNHAAFGSRFIDDMQQAAGED